MHTYTYIYIYIPTYIYKHTHLTYKLFLIKVRYFCLCGEEDSLKLLRFQFLNIQINLVHGKILETPLAIVKMVFYLCYCFISICLLIYGSLLLFPLLHRIIITVYLLLGYNRGLPLFCAVSRDSKTGTCNEKNPTVSVHSFDGSSYLVNTITTFIKRHSLFNNWV